MIFEPFDQKKPTALLMMKRPQHSMGPEKTHKNIKQGRLNREAERNPTTYAAYHRMVWRWHFYAGIFCLPFITILSLTGSIYLFKPQFDVYFDQPYNNLSLASEPKTLDEQVSAAVASQPGNRLKNLEIRPDRSDAARVHFLNAKGEPIRVLVRPDTLEILKTEFEKSQFTSIIHDLHGELLLGVPGAILVELAGAWAIIMILTGLYLWWPDSNDGAAGVLYPRFRSKGRTLLKDLHSVTGFWISLFALFFLISALPWTTVWGGSLKYLRSIGQPIQSKQDWTTGPASAKAQKLNEFNNAAKTVGLDEHAEHQEHGNHHSSETLNISGFDQLAPHAVSFKLEEPVLLSPPSMVTPNWKLQSETQNRPQRKTIEFDPKTFRQVSEKSFADKPLLDKIIGTGIAAHEGQLFGVFNQLLGLMTALGYLLLVATSTLMWWKRRPQGSFGAPALILPIRKTPNIFIGMAIVLGIFLPTLGVSLFAVLIFEFIAQRFLPRTSRWLGLEPIN